MQALRNIRSDFHMKKSTTDYITSNFLMAVFLSQVSFFLTFHNVLRFQIMALTFFYFINFAPIFLVTPASRNASSNYKMKNTEMTQPAISCSKLTKETLEQGVKFAQI